MKTRRSRYHGHRFPVEIITPTSELVESSATAVAIILDLANRNGGLRVTIVVTQPAKLVLLG